jgi:hypothetical protein
LTISSVVNGELVFTRLSTDEESGAFNAVRRQYLNQVGRRVSVFASLRHFEDACPQVIHRAFEAVGAFEDLRTSFEGVEGFLHPQEGFALYQLPNMARPAGPSSRSAAFSDALAAGWRPGRVRRGVKKWWRSIISAVRPRLQPLAQQAAGDMRQLSRHRVAQGLLQCVRQVEATK